MKPFWKSKTFWAMVVTAAVGIYESMRQGGYPLPELPGIVITILAGLGLYGRFVAHEPLSISKVNGDE